VADPPGRRKPERPADPSLEGGAAALGNLDLAPTLTFEF
jgi:hypothetical protein